MRRSRHSVDRKIRPRCRGAAFAATGSGIAGTIETELWSDAAQGFNAKREVLVERDAKLLGAVVDVVATHAARERFVFQLLLYGCCFHLVDTFRGFDERAGCEEAREFVTGEEGTIERRNARDAGIARVSKDR